MDEAHALEAIVSAYHFWLMHDGIQIEIVRRNGGVLTPVCVASIARPYSIARTLPAGSTERIAGLVNECAATLSQTDLKGAAAACVDVARSIAALRPLPDDSTETPKTPYSAVSKLLWFVRPVGWTMYDSYASAGIGAQGAGSARFLNFYRRLDQAGFDDLLACLRPRLENAGLPPLLAERVVDYELMRRGQRETPHPGPYWVDAALETFGGTTASQLRNFAKAAASDLANFARD